MTVSGSQVTCDSKCINSKCNSQVSHNSMRNNQVSHCSKCSSHVSHNSKCSSHVWHITTYHLDNIGTLSFQHPLRAWGGGCTSGRAIYNTTDSNSTSKLTNRSNIALLWTDIKSTIDKKSTLGSPEMPLPVRAGSWRPPWPCHPWSASGDSGFWRWGGAGRRTCWSCCAAESGRGWGCRPAAAVSSWGHQAAAGTAPCVETGKQQQSKITPVPSWGHRAAAGTAPCAETGTTTNSKKKNKTRSLLG